MWELTLNLQEGAKIVLRFAEIGEIWGKGVVL